MFGMKETELLAEAQEALGAEAEILGAGIFSLASLSLASIAGGAAGATIGANFNEAATIVGSIAARHAAMETVAASQNASVRLLVAITPEYIYVLNTGLAADLRHELARFHRDEVESKIDKMGASRYLTLTDTQTGDHIQLHGSVGWLSAQAEGDRVVFDLLANTPHES